MDWLGDIANLMSGGGFAAVTGLVGGWLAKKEARKMKQLDYSHEESMMKYQVQEAQEERKQAIILADKNMELAEVEGAIEIESKSMDAFTAAIQGQDRASGIPIIDGILKFVRPILSVWLLIELVELRERLDTLTGGLNVLPQAALVTMYTNIVNAFITLTIMGISFWYASRKGQF